MVPRRSSVAKKGEMIITATNLLFILIVLVVGYVGYKVGKLVGIRKIHEAKRLRGAARFETDPEMRAILYDEADRTEEPQS